MTAEPHEYRVRVLAYPVNPQILAPIPVTCLFQAYGLPRSGSSGRDFSVRDRFADYIPWGYLPLLSRGYMLERLIRLSWLVGSISLLLGGCGSMDQSRAVELVNSRHLATAPVTDLNRDIALRANPGPTKPQDYEVGPEDLLEITLFNIDPQKDGLPGNMRLRVSQTGFITLPLLGETRVNGFTPAQLEQFLRERYGKFMYGPDVGVTVAEYRSQWISVLGAVKNPGVFQISGPRRLRDLLAMAGGVTNEAGIFAHISRQDAEGEQSYVINLYDLSQDASGELNVPVRPGDVLDVPQAGTFFVDGYVGKPGAYPLLREYTLTQALTLAGGVQSNAKLGDVTVFRRNAKGEIQVLKFDLARIRVQEAQDVQVIENDVIVVPASMAKLVIGKLFQAVGLSIRSSSFGFGFGGGY